MPRLFNLPHIVIGLVIVLGAILGGLMVFAPHAEERINPFAGIQIMDPDRHTLLTLGEPQHGILTTLIQNDRGAVTGVIALDSTNTFILDTGASLAPFKVLREGGYEAAYVGYFEVRDGVLLHTRSIVLGRDATFLSVERRGKRGVVIHFVNAVGAPSFVYATMSDSVPLVEGYRVENGAIGDVFVNQPSPNAQVVPGVLSVSGEARGTWFFEANLPVQVLDATKKIIAQAPLTATSDWMTEELVPFTGTIAIPRGVGIIYLRVARDNPSGDPERDGFLEMPLSYRYEP